MMKVREYTNCGSTDPHVNVEIELVSYGYGKALSLVVEYGKHQILEWKYITWDGTEFFLYEILWCKHHPKFHLMNTVSDSLVFSL